MHNWLPKIEEALRGYLAPPDAPYRSAAEAMAYSAEAGGKRIRPLLTLLFCELAGGEPEKALPFACAVEMVHTYSLIHDDLPCMDNDDFRRGRPSCHKQFGEATALLAGDGLLTKAFETLAEADLPPDRIVRAVRILSRCAGTCGMIGGQVLDLQNETQSPDAPTLELTYRLKTSALLQAACLLGVAAAGGDETAARDAREYADSLGIAFQIIDDILDVVGDESLLGKPLSSDAANGKATSVSLYGLEESRRRAAAYTQKALRVLETYPHSGELAALTRQLLDRNY